jgi:hypothetical protein
MNQKIVGPSPVRNGLLFFKENYKFENDESKNQNFQNSRDPKKIKMRYVRDKFRKNQNR